jgi:hypothetical protein
MFQHPALPMALDDFSIDFDGTFKTGDRIRFREDIIGGGLGFKRLDGHRVTEAVVTTIEHTQRAMLGGGEGHALYLLLTTPDGKTARWSVSHLSRLRPARMPRPSDNAQQARLFF